MCTLQTEAPTILMPSSCRVFGHRFRCIVMFNEMLDICAFWWRWLRNAAGTPSNPSAKSQNGTHHGLALTTMRHTRCHPTCRETKDVSVTSRHDAEHAVISNATKRKFCEIPVDFTLTNTTENHMGKRQLIADIAHPTFSTESESFSSRRASLLNPMSVSSGLKRPHQKWIVRDTCRSSSQSCRCTPMFGSGLFSNEI